MARIAGVDIPLDKRVDVSLRYIFGIGITRASTICENARLEPSTKVRDLTDDEISRIRELDRKSTRLNSSHIPLTRMPSSA